MRQHDARLLHLSIISKVSIQSQHRKTTWHTFSRLGAIESISSMKMIAGEFFSASSKAFLKLLSLSPTTLLMISGPLIKKENAPLSFATARAIRVLPVPGGPNKRIPHGGLILIDLKTADGAVAAPRAHEFEPSACGTHRCHRSLHRPSLSPRLLSSPGHPLQVTK